MRVHQMQGHDVAGDAAQQDQGRGIRGGTAGLQAQGQQLGDLALEHAPADGIHGDDLAFFQQTGGTGQVDDRGHAEFTADRRHVTGKAARLGDDGRGPLHGHHGVGRGVLQEHDRAFGEVGEVLRRMHMDDGAAAHALGRHFAAAEQGTQVRERRGRHFADRGVQTHGPGLEQDDLVVFVHGPFHVLRVLVMAFQFQRHGGQLLRLLMRQAGHVAQAFGHVLFLALHAVASGSQHEADLLVGDGLLLDAQVGARDQPVVRGGRAVHHHLAQAPGALDHDAVGAQVHGMPGEGHAGRLGLHHLETAHAHAGGVQRIAVAGAVGQGTGREQTGQHTLEGRGQALARGAEDAQVLAGKGLHPVLVHGTGAQGGLYLAVFAESLVPAVEQGFFHFFGQRGLQDQVLHGTGSVLQAVGHVGVHLAQGGMDLLEQAAGAQQGQAAGLDGDREAGRHGHVQHVAQFAQVGVLAAHAVAHAGVHFRQGQDERIDVAAGMLLQLVLDVPPDGSHAFFQILVAVARHVVEAGRHAFAVEDRLAGDAPHLMGLQMLVTALGRVQLGQDGGQVRIGLEQLVEGGVATAKSGHGLLAADARLQAKQAFESLDGRGHGTSFCFPRQGMEGRRRRYARPVPGGVPPGADRPASGRRPTAVPSCHGRAASGAEPACCRQHYIALGRAAPFPADKAQTDQDLQVVLGGTHGDVLA